MADFGFVFWLTIVCYFLQGGSLTPSQLVSALKEGAILLLTIGVSYLENKLVLIEKKNILFVAGYNNYSYLGYNAAGVASGYQVGGRLWIQH